MDHPSPDPQAHRAPLVSRLAPVTLGVVGAAATVTTFGSRDPLAAAGIAVLFGFAASVSEWSARARARSMAEQMAAAHDIARRVEMIAQGAEQNSASVGRTAELARQLQAMADALNTSAVRFRIV